MFTPKYIINTVTDHIQYKKLLALQASTCKDSSLHYIMLHCDIIRLQTLTLLTLTQY